MTKALFCHDHRFIENNDAIYSEGQFGSALWDRYLRHFDCLEVVARKQTMAEALDRKAALVSADAKKVSFKLVGSLSSPGALLLDPRGVREQIAASVAGSDAVIARLPSEVGLAAISAAIKQKKPWAIELVACPWDGLWNYGSFVSRAYAPILYARTRLAVAEGRYVIYVTQRFLQRRYPAPRALTTGVSNVALESASSAALERRLERLAVPMRRAFKIGMIGSLKGRFKGIHIAIAAVAELSASFPDVSLHILGGGAPVDHWQNLAQSHGVADKVHFSGTLPHGEAVWSWIDDKDLYIQPSLMEGLPRALIEAMSRGAPAIGTRVAGMPELLHSEDLVRAGSVSDLADKLRRRIDDESWKISADRKSVV